MKNKIDFITNKLEKMTDIICKMYDCKIIKDDDDENKNEINKMFDELKNKNDQKDNELLNVKIMKNKIDFITNKLEKMTDIICKMYDCKIIKDDDDENKNEINKMFDELKNKNDQKDNELLNVK
eukprot:8430_1